LLGSFLFRAGRAGSFGSVPRIERVSDAGRVFHVVDAISDGLVALFII
jgi:hypothetical protein